MKKYRSNSKSKSAIMKHFILTAIFAAMCQHGAAQTTEEVATELGNPTGLHIIGTNLYVTENSSRRISKINLVTEVKTIQYVTTETKFASPTGLDSKGTDLYIAIGNQASISKIDISNTLSTSVDSIYESIPDLLTVTDIVFDGNTLYASSFLGNKIVKIADITAETLVVSDVITTGISNTRGLLLNGDNLYVTSGNAGGKLSKIDLTAATPVAMEVLTGLHTPTYMALEGDNLYISERGAGKVLTIDITEQRQQKQKCLQD